MKKSLLLGLVLLQSCSLFQKAPRIPGPIPAKKIVNFPGHATMISLNIPMDYQVESLICGKDTISLFDGKNETLAFVGTSYHNEVKDYDCTLTFTLDGKKHSQKIVDIDVKEYKFPSETLRVNPKRVTPSKEDQERASREWKMMKKIYDSLANPNPLFDKPFARPLNSKITTIYGSKRVFNGIRKSWHSGIDFRAAVGTRIPVANRGQVVFTGDLFYAGKTVVIDHGAGVFSMYCHLSKIIASVGDMVNQFDIIGLAGKTGRVTGPHLHWAVKVNGHWINGFSMVKITNEWMNNESTL